MNRILRNIQLKDPNPTPETYPFTIPAVQNIGTLEFHEACTFLIGENGSGKSTLIEAIAIKAGFNPEGGTKNFNFAHRPSESTLSESIRLTRGINREKSGFFLRAETIFNVATEAEANNYQWDKLHELSHGEAFLWIILNRFGPNGLYILDEPEAALSPQRQLTLLARIHELTQQGAQFIISTHSPILMAYPQATLYHLHQQGITPTQYEETEHYQVTSHFLKNRHPILKELFKQT